MKRLIPMACVFLLLATPASPQPPAQPPSRTPTPAPSPGTVVVPPGQPLPLRQWVERPVSNLWGKVGGESVARVEEMGLGPSKHTRMFYHPGLKAMVIAGGDRVVSMPRPNGYSNGTGSEIISLDAQNDRWKTVRPFCVPGEPQPGRPDNVVWALDKKRNRALMVPGFYFITQGNTSGCGAIEGWGGYAFSFDTNKFTGPDDPTIMVPAPVTAEFQNGGWGGDNNLAFGLVDHVADELLLFKNGLGMERMNLGTKVWRLMRLNAGNLHRCQPVIDEAGRAVYLLQPPHLLKIFLDRHGHNQQESIPLPPQYVPPADGSQELYLVFDTINRLVLIPNNTGMGQSPILGLGIYHVDTKTWEWEAVPPAVAGSLWGFDENVGAMVGIGKRSVPYAYFLYKRGPSAPSPAQTLRRAP